MTVIFFRGKVILQHIHMVVLTADVFQLFIKTYTSTRIQEGVVSTSIACYGHRGEEVAGFVFSHKRDAIDYTAMQ